MAHTKGPWKAKLGAVMTEDENWLICDSGDWGGVISDPDAQLIAAAPDLLEALKLLLDEHQSLVTGHASENGISDGSDLWPELGVARRAIAKAEPK